MSNLGVQDPSIHRFPHTPRYNLPTPATVPKLHVCQFFYLLDFFSQITYHQFQESGPNFHPIELRFWHFVVATLAGTKPSLQLDPYYMATKNSAWLLTTTKTSRQLTEFKARVLSSKPSSFYLTILGLLVSRCLSHLRKPLYFIYLFEKGEGRRIDVKAGV